MANCSVKRSSTVVRFWVRLVWCSWRLASAAWCLTAAAWRWTSAASMLVMRPFSSSPSLSIFEGEPRGVETCDPRRWLSCDSTLTLADADPCVDAVELCGCGTHDGMGTCVARLRDTWFSDLGGGGGSKDHGTEEEMQPLWLTELLCTATSGGDRRLGAEWVRFS